MLRVFFGFLVFLSFFLMRALAFSSHTSNLVFDIEISWVADTCSDSLLLLYLLTGRLWDATLLMVRLHWPSHHKSRGTME